ncbi:hypothetical protein [Anatilimnocola floriformis]|uniref:hypothetical protein n=1 Tax=Anatilimnocola floriformis TaxID=2948575 RepID=UPI0020C4C572|nr:hypothetical protein [Anatilimnocola floriformis]
MATIGSLNVNLGMSTAAFSAGAKKATETVKSLASGVSSAASAIPGLGVAIAGIGAALGAGALLAGFQSMVKGSMETIDATGDLAGRIGVTTEALSRLQYAAQLTGSEAESVAPALGKLNANLGKAKEGGEFADTLAEIGLSATALKELDPAEAFVQIADGIGKLESPSDKASAALAIFGKQGEGLINTFNSGGDAIRVLMEESDKLGNTITDVDAAKVGAANDALDKMWKVLGGIANRVAVEVAPFIEQAATALVNFGLEGNRVGMVVSVGFEVLAKSIAFVADMWDVLVLGFKGAQYLITKGLAYIASLWIQVGKGIAWVVQQMGYEVDTTFLDSLDNELHAAADAIGTDFQERLIGKSSGEKVTAFFDNIRNGAQKAAEATAQITKQNKGLAESFDESADSVSKLVAKYKEQLDLFGLEGRAAEIEKLRREDADPKKLAQAQALSDELTRREGDKKRLGDAQQMRDALQSPLQKFQAEMKRIADLTAKNPQDLANGLLSGDEALLAKLQAQRDLLATDQPQADPGSNRPAALERGTAAAFTASFGPVAKPIDRVAKLTNELLIVQKRIEEKLGEAKI